MIVVLAFSPKFDRVADLICGIGVIAANEGRVLGTGTPVMTVGRVIIPAGGNAAKWLLLAPSLALVQQRHFSYIVSPL